MRRRRRRLRADNVLPGCNASGDVHDRHRNQHVRRKRLQLGPDINGNGARQMKRKRKLLRFVRPMADESGAAAVEFAIVSAVFITFIFGIAYTAIMLHYRAALQWAVETTIRQAALDRNVTQGQLTTTLNDHLQASHLPNASTVNFSVATVGGVDVATLTASFSDTYTIPMVGTFNNTYTATAKTPQNAAPPPGFGGPAPAPGP